MYLKNTASNKEITILIKSNLEKGFHPECKNKMVNNSTKYFQGIFLLPFMRLNGKDRILDFPDDLEHIFEGDREYGGEDDQINYIKSFNYDEIPELVNNLKNWI